MTTKYQPNDYKKYEFQQLKDFKKSQKRLLNENNKSLNEHREKLVPLRREIAAQDPKICMELVALAGFGLIGFFSPLWLVGVALAGVLTVVSYSKRVSRKKALDQTVDCIFDLNCTTRMLNQDLLMIDEAIQYQLMLNPGLSYVEETQLDDVAAESAETNQIDSNFVQENSADQESSESVSETAYEDVQLETSINQPESPSNDGISWHTTNLTEHIQSTPEIVEVSHSGYSDYGSHSHSSYESSSSWDSGSSYDSGSSCDSGGCDCGGGGD